MNVIEGMAGDFRRARIVYLVTFSKKGEHSRPMTNFNEDPYVMMWFPTYRDTRKVEDIRTDPKVLVIFPATKDDRFYEIEGRAEFEDEKVTEQKWQWWYLYWHPEQADRFWFPHAGEHPERVIINIYPVSARVVDKKDLEMISAPYRSYKPKEEGS